MSTACMLPRLQATQRAVLPSRLGMLTSHPMGQVTRGIFDEEIYCNFIFPNLEVKSDEFIYYGQLFRFLSYLVSKHTNNWESRKEQRLGQHCKTDRQSWSTL